MGSWNEVERRNTDDVYHLCITVMLMKSVDGW
jgi:hypothetical protein